MDFLIRKNAKNNQRTVISPQDTGFTKALGNMTKIFTKNLARSADILFLKDLVVTKACDKAKRAIQEEAPKSWLPITHDSIRLIEQAKSICEQRIYLDEAKELFSLISSKWLQAVLEIHDEVAAQIQNNTEEVEYIDGVSSIDCDDEELDFDDRRRLIFSEPDDKEKHKGDKNEEDEVRVDTFRVVGIRRQAGEPIGLTVRIENGRVTVARILSDSLIDRQGLLHTGDIIVEANGKRIRTPEELLKIFEGKSDVDEIRSSGKLSTITTVSSSGTQQTKEKTLNSINLDEELKPSANSYDANEFITLKIEPAMTESQSFISKPADEGKHYIRANFDYDPGKDNLIPCQDIGLKFKSGDIIEIVNWSDPCWWQARKVNYKEPPGLVPSQDLEERRKCFVQFDEADYNQLYCCSSQGGRKNKRHYDYFVSQNLDFDRAELALYEPVEKMPPFSRKTLVLVSHPALESGKNKLIHRIIDSNPDMFAEAKRATTKMVKEEEKDKYFIISAEEMSEALANNEFLSHREDEEGYLEGITFASIVDVMRESKLCLIDCQPNSLKLLHNSINFMPYVIFLIPPSVHKIEVVNERSKEGTNTIRRKSKEIATEYCKYFDQEIEFEDVDSTIKKIMNSLESLATETQWVPRNWVYS